MELHFVRPDLLNTVFRDEHGRPRYRTETNGTAFGFSERTTTISRIVGGDPSLYPDTERVTADDKSDTDIFINGLEEQPVSQIVWRRVAQSIFKYDGKEVKVKDLFQSQTGVKAKKHTFTASNGQMYTWVATAHPCWLEKGPSGTTPPVKIVEGKGRSHGIRPGKEAHYPWLKVSEECLPILDEILMTFVWAERRRAEDYNDEY
ncbi:hypothetical protein PENSPDRAFT_749813 [Peniophora sp. CONT]|nr:hypothetical protein PENSPDRAFT_749813 [Peniophora sp. CONT]